MLKKICEIGVGFSFAALSVFRPRRAEAVSALWIPHWHSEPFESQGARAAKRYVNGNLVEREKHHLNLHLNLHLTSEWAVPRVAGRFSDSETSWVLPGGAEGSFLCSLSSRFSGRGGGVESLPGAWRRVGV